MNPWDTICLGIKEIWAHKFRSMLTMLGIILGVSSLVAMSALVKGMENGMKEALVAMGGLEKVRVEFQDDLPAYQKHLTDQAPGLLMKDVFALQAGAPLVENITPIVEQHGYRTRINVTYQNKRARPWRLYGTWPGILELEDHRVRHGRMFTELDNEMARSVCVIGVELRNDLFGDPEKTGEEIIPIGKTIRINGQPFTIIGMFEHYMTEKERKELELERLRALENPQPGGVVRDKGRKGSGPSGYVFRLKNNSIFIPLKTMMIQFRAAAGLDETADPRLSGIYMKVRDISVLETALQQIRNVLLVSHGGIEDWSFRTEEDLADGIQLTIKNFRMSGVIIAAIALVVGGIGIMNIMLASISERIREIGIRKAVGATNTDVFVQIIIESLVIAVVGGLMGLGVSVMLVNSITAFTPTENNPVVTVEAMLFAFSCSAMVGIVAGMIPALKASKLHPIEALKYD
ncbi:MAG: ABC transporter permease [Verrucomicrobiota bacterium]|nr:ABC transporter permease [Verrucomicrobiota bacterium]